MLKPICDATFVISALVLQYICHACSCSAVHFHTCSCSAVHLSYLLLFCSAFFMPALVLQYIFIPALVLQYIFHTCACSAIYLSYLLLFCSIFFIPTLVLQYICHACSCSAVRFTPLPETVISCTCKSHWLLLLYIVPVEFVFTDIILSSIYRLHNSVDNASPCLNPTTNSKLGYNFFEFYIVVGVSQCHTIITYLVF